MQPEARTVRLRNALHLLVLSTPVLAFAPTASAGDGALQQVTEERVRVAFADARAALESVPGVKLGAVPTIEFVTGKEIGACVAAENLPIVRLRQPDEEKARVEADSIGSAVGGTLLAKYSWSRHALLVAPETFETNARLLDAPELTSDQGLRAVLVHELAHAWDDATYDLTSLVGRASSLDAANALAAVIEGHAQLVARRVCEARGWSAGFEAFSSCIGKIPASSKLLGEAQMALLRQQASASEFTYRKGEAFIAALEQSGGADAVARAFRQPPPDGETILHPQWFLQPGSRPEVLYDAEPALDLFAARFPETEWSSQRQGVPTDQIEQGLSVLPKAEAHALAQSIRNERVIVLYPTANPNAKMAAVSVLEFGTEEQALAFFSATDRVSDLKDGQMKSGVLRVTSSTRSTIQAGDIAGVLRVKQMQNRSLAFEVHSVDVVRGKLLIETLFSGEPIAIQEHAELAVSLLQAVRQRDNH